MPINPLSHQRLIGWLLVFPVTLLADSIPSGYHKIANHYHIPASVLYAVALTESGQTVDKGLFRPWPWTLNVAGKPQRFASRIAACRELNRHLARGIPSIDIGI